MENSGGLIMLVDDDLTNLSVGKSALADTYTVLTVPSAARMFQLLERHRPDLILLDVDMPEMDGFTAIQRLKQHEATQDITVIFVSAKEAMEDMLQGMSLGAVDYVTKPFNAQLLNKRVEIHINIKRMTDQLKKQKEVLAQINQEEMKTIWRLRSNLLVIIAELIESRDITTGNHIKNTRNVLAILTAELNARNLFPEETRLWDIEKILLSSQLHDIGKIAVSDAILLKPGPLTAEEFAQMKEHVVRGVDILEKKLHGENGIDEMFFNYSRVLIGTHHEKWDGSGYPHHLKGEQIPLLGRLMAIADVYDALTSVRPYKKAFLPDEALDIIKKSSGTHFDPRIVDLFVSCSDKIAAKKQLESFAIED